MTAGTSTGSILSAGLSMPANHDFKMPAYFASDLLNIYTTRYNDIFIINKFDLYIRMIYISITTIIFTLFGL